jgi:16S rRNA (cytosine967-C5)-methyltransferase
MKEKSPSGLEPRLAAWRAIHEFQKGNGWVQGNLAAACGHLSPRDRALAYEIALGATRKHFALLALIQKMCPKLPTAKVVLLLEISLYQLLCMRIPGYSVVDTAVKLSRRLSLGEGTAKLVNAVLRRALREELRLPKNAEFPAWLEGHLSDAQKKAATQAPAQWVRFKTPRQDLLFGRYERVSDVGEILRGQEFARGLCSFQNPASFLIVELLDMQDGMRLWDACAAPGGKTALAAEMFPNAKIVASDLKTERLKKMDDLTKRLNLHNIKVIQLDASNPDASKPDTANPEFKEPFDRVLVDAPCSNLGVLSRRPEVLQRLTPQDLKTLPKLQLQILQGAAQAVKPGGVLVYATCSPEASETTAVVEQFLKARPGWELEKQIFVEDAPNGLDLFFGAKLRRAA